MVLIDLFSPLFALALLLEGLSGFLPASGRLWGAFCGLFGHLLAPLRRVLPRPWGLDLSNLVLVLLLGVLRILLRAGTGL